MGSSTRSHEYGSKGYLRSQKNIFSRDHPSLGLVLLTSLTPCHFVRHKTSMAIACVVSAPSGGLKSPLAFKALSTIMPFPAPAAPATSSKSPKLISREAPGNRIQMGNWNGSRAGHGSKEYNAWQFPLFDNADFKIQVAQFVSSFCKSSIQTRVKLRPQKEQTKTKTMAVLS